MTILRTLRTNSAIYAATNLAHRGAAFLLMPLYTIYLDPAAYGVLGVVTAINGFLGIAFTVGLGGSVARFYFEYRDDSRMLGEFWGAVLAFIMVLSLILGAFLFVLGDWLLRPLIGDVRFWPYVALGVATTVFQPLFATFLVILQTRNEAVRFAVMALAHFLLTTFCTILFVVVFRWGVSGALVAILVSTAAFFGISIWNLRAEVRFRIRWQHLRPALTHALPQVPHSLASQTTAMSDRLILNSRLGTESAGLYAVGSMISMVVEVAAASVNRAYVPLSMAALKSRNASELEQIRIIGLTLVTGFCILGAFIGVFASEIIGLLTPPAFERAASVVPVLVFGGVASAIYYLLVNILFFDRQAIRLLPICTLSAAALNVSLALLLIPRIGLGGAAVATLIAQIVATLLVGIVGARYDPVRWNYVRYAAAFAGSLAFTIAVAKMSASSDALLMLAKLSGLVGLAIYLGIVLWFRPLFLAESVVRFVRRMFLRRSGLSNERRTETR